MFDSVMHEYNYSYNIHSYVMIVKCVHDFENALASW